MTSNTARMNRYFRPGPWLTLLLLLCVCAGASAQTRAWLDRDRIGLGETVTLNIETTSPVSTEPDYTPLDADFAVSGNSSQRSFVMANGRSQMKSLFAVALRPRRDGIITIPALSVGSERTQPIVLTVAPGRAQTPARAGDDVFIESVADDEDPYVQQAVGWVVRLYSAVPLVSGELDQPAPDGASLQRVGDDAQYQRDVGGRRYFVVERRFLLVPERSGELAMPSARFEGRGTGGFFDDIFGDRGGALQAQAAPRFLQVRAIPPGAPQPWLPLQNLKLRYATTPQELRVGEAATLTVEAVADGATAAQMPELQLPAIDGVQVFAEPVQADERFADGRPQVKLTRRFSLVPSRAGATQLRGARLAWWDVRSGASREAVLPALSWSVAVGASASAPAAASPTPTTATPSAPVASSAIAALRGAHPGWVLATLLFAALWLFTLVWGLHRRDPAATPPLLPGAPGTTRPAQAADQRDLKRLLDHGDLGELLQALCAMAQPPAADAQDLLQRLDDPRQREAVEALQRARWGGGDAVTARALLRQAFAKGPQWRRRPGQASSPLPPLYPP